MPIACGSLARFSLVLLLVALMPASGTADTAPARDCLATSDDLKAVLSMPGARKSGQTFCLEGGHYEGLSGSDFLGAFTGIDPARPVVFEAADPDNPPILRRWLFGANRKDRLLKQDNGNAILRGLVFDLTDEPEVPIGENGFRGSRSAISLGGGRPTRNVTLENITVRGPLRQGREGGRETTQFLFGVFGLWTSDITVRNSRFEGIVHAVALGGTNLLIEGNRMRHSWGDLIEISPQVLPDRACEDTRNVTIRNNMIYDIWSNNRIHPDVVHMFAASHVPCSIHNVLIEGTLAFPGDVGLLQPAYPTGLRNSAPGPVPAAIPAQDRQLHRLIGPGTTVLPPAHCPEETILMGVQLDPESSGPITLNVRPGEWFNLDGNEKASHTLDAPWESWRISCRKGRSGEWHLLRAMPSLQGIFTNSLPGSAGFHDITIRHNILWVTAPQAIGFRDADNSNILVERNSFIAPWPGDLNGDGAPNQFEDGFNTRFRNAWILLENGKNLQVTGTVASAPLKIKGANNDASLVHNDAAIGVSRRFSVVRQSAEPSPATGQIVTGPRLNPVTPAEAVALARPRPDGQLAGWPIGAVAQSPDEDPYDWSWVDAPW